MRKIVVNPDIPDAVSRTECECIATPATVGVPAVVAELLAEAHA